MGRGRATRWAAAAGIGLLLAACDGVSGDKVGELTSPVTLRLGTADGPDRPGAKQVERFAAEVAALSDGAITIEPVWEAAGDDWPREWDQLVARQVMSGDLAMAMVPARAWDTEGVTTLQAVHAPLLVTSQELVERIVTDEVASDLLAGLEDVGVTGLALLPEGIRRLFLVDGQASSFGDLAGELVRAPRSATAYALFEAMGAVPDDPNGPEVDALTVAAWESSLDLHATMTPTEAGTGLAAIGDLALFPKLNTLVINREALDGLGEGPQQVLRDAAARTLAWSIDQLVGESVHAGSFCASGGRIVHASGEDRAVIERAAADVLTELEGDGTTRDLLARIDALAADLAGVQETVEPCADSQAQAQDPRGQDGDVAAFPAGVYRMEISAEELVSKGVDPVTADNNAGVWTTTYRDGILTSRDVNALTGKVEEGEGVYCVTGDRIALGFLRDPPTCGDFASARWSLEGDQLRFFDIQSHHGSDLLIEVLLGSKPWVKIG